MYANKVFEIYTCVLSFSPKCFDCGTYLAIRSYGVCHMLKS
uniref:Uncharacterized protein n=1 Tax=White spot syndrome virus TaxID=342409 RepID=A0A6B9MQC8_9VIRU|nr:hypothetical protein [White spot syndrome virus]WOG35314.1 hypothetical protein [White spot syndrome virus]